MDPSSFHLTLGSRPGATTAYAASAATSGSDPGGDGVQSAAKRKQPSAAHARGGHSQHKHRLEATRPSRPSPSPRPYVQALEALERLTSAAGKPHDGVSSAVLSATAATTTAGDNFPQLLLSVSSPSSAGVIGSEVVEKGERASGEQQRPQSAVDSGREGAGRSGQGASMSSGGYRCRVGFDMIRLLTGPDANDAGGTPVGVRPGEDVEAAVLGGSGSKVWPGCCHDFGVMSEHRGICRGFSGLKKVHILLRCFSFSWWLNAQVRAQRCGRGGWASSSKVTCVTDANGGELPLCLSIQHHHHSHCDVRSRNGSWAA